MRNQYWAVLALGLVAACDAHQSGARPGSDAADAAADAGADVDAGLPPLIDAVRTEVALYDRRIRAVCPCLVAQGLYQTDQECLDLGLSGPDWVSCATMALASYDNAMTRAQSQCYFDFLRQTAECVEMSNCDVNQLAVCGNPDQDCLARVIDRLNLILTQCPSFGLLSRVKS